MSCANFGEPATLVRSPIMMKLLAAEAGLAGGRVPASELGGGDWLSGEGGWEGPSVTGVATRLPRIVPASSPLSRRQGSS